MTNEVFWKPVVGYEELYEVSNLKRVKRLSFNGRPQKRPSIAKGSFRQGYSIVGLTKEHKTKVNLWYVIRMGLVPTTFPRIFIGGMRKIMLKTL